MRRLLLVLSLLSVSTQIHAAVSATLDSGPVAGAERDGVRSFLGIPYAAAPVGALRWQAPQPVVAWKAERDAREYGAACPQPEDKAYGLTPPVQDEDCLFLNVWAPAPAKSPLPVMVWLHGGANRMGAGSIPFYDGSHLAQRGVVVVTINYRLGYLGFFAHEALEGRGGNYALMDQIAALKWVRKNIAAFGGDPGNVTVFGESAGGADTLFLMASPALDPGLFHKAIVQSGGGWNRPPTAKAFGKKILKSFGAAGLAETMDATALRALKPAQLVDALAKNAGIGFGPFLDGVTTVEAPSQALADGRAAKVPMIIGSNDWEASLIKLRGTNMLSKFLSHLPPFSSWYAPRETTAEQRQELMFTDVVFGAPARWIAARHSKQAPTWLYRFEYVTSGSRDKLPGAGHAAEIAYVFDTVGVTPKSAANAGPEDQAMADRLSDCWVSFARSGQPACAFPWDAYDAARDNLLLVDRAPKQVVNPQARAQDGAERWFGPGSFLGGL